MEIKPPYIKHIENQFDLIIFELEFDWLPDAKIVAYKHKPFRVIINFKIFYYLILS